MTGCHVGTCCALALSVMACCVTAKTQATLGPDGEVHEWLPRQPSAGGTRNSVLRSEHIHDEQTYTHNDTHNEGEEGSLHRSQSSAGSLRKHLVPGHDGSLSEVKSNGDTAEQVVSMKTNGGLFTLQGIPSGGLPMSCNVPECSRSDTCKGTECCSTQMFNALSAITDWMKSHSVKYSVLFGTLLGAHRDEDIIPWTGDLDIGIYSKDVAKLIDQTDIPWKFAFKDSFTIPRGCENHKPGQQSGFQGKYSEFTMGNGGFCSGSDPTSCSYYIDLYVLDSPENGGNIAKKCIQNSMDPSGKDNIMTTAVKIRGKEFDGPSAVEDCLVAEYGRDWNTPDQKKSFHGL